MFSLMNDQCGVIVWSIYIICFEIRILLGFMVKSLHANAGDSGLIPGSGSSSGGGRGNPLQYSCLGNPMDRGVWRATVHRVTQSRTWLKQPHTHAHTLSKYHELKMLVNYSTPSLTPNSSLLMPGNLAQFLKLRFFLSCSLYPMLDSPCYHPVVPTQHLYSWPLMAGSDSGALSQSLYYIGYMAGLLPLHSISNSL